MVEAIQQFFEFTNSIQAGFPPSNIMHGSYRWACAVAIFWKSVVSKYYTYRTKSRIGSDFLFRNGVSKSYC